MFILFSLKKHLNACCVQVSVIDEGLLKFSKLEELMLSANKITEIPAENLPSTLKASLTEPPRTVPFPFLPVSITSAIMSHGSPVEGSGAPFQPSVFPGRARRPPASLPAAPRPRLQHSGFLR